MEEYGKIHRGEMNLFNDFPGYKLKIAGETRIEANP